jgi:hypothetical protein
MKELNDIQTVCDCLGTWWGQIHTRAAQGLLDINRVSEDVAVTLLNLVFNLELKNLNQEKKNFPGIDLGDDTNKKAFQVTSRKDPAKIKKDINTFIETHKGRFPGGMGKTVSLLHWWEKLLEPGGPGKPIPVFIALNQLNQVPAGKREDFILNRIAADYTENSLTTDQVKKAMKTPAAGEENFVPSMVLLLDGFNEITVDKRELLLELNHLTEQCPGIQVVITSRYDMRGN